MIAIPDLQTALLDLLDEIQGTDIRLIVGGGYGMYVAAEKCDAIMVSFDEDFDRTERKNSRPIST